MAITGVGTLGTGTSSLSSSSLLFTTATNSLAAGDYGILTVVTDNIATADGETNTHTSVSGGTGTWSKIGEYTNSPGGVAADGVTTSLWLFASSGTNGTGTGIAVNLSANCQDKVGSFYKFTVASGTTLAVGTGFTNPIVNEVTASNGFGSVAFSGLTNQEWLFFRGLGKEANSTTALTVSSGFTAITNQRSRNNAAAVGVWGEFDVATSTGLTSNPTLAVSGDTAGVYAALYEAGGNVSLDAATGAYTLTGSPSTQDVQLPTSEAAYTTTGTDATFEVATPGPSLAALAGDYTLTGSPSSGEVALTATQGSTTVTGADAGLDVLIPFTASSTSYTLTGQPSSGTVGIYGAPSAYTVTGTDSTLVVATLFYYLPALAGSPTITGSPAALTFVLPSYTCTIAGEPCDIQPNWRITETLNGRNVMSFDVLSLDGSYRPASRAEVVFKYGVTTLFAGTISDKDEAGLGGMSVTPVVTRCGAIDYNALPDRRQVAVYLAQGLTLKQCLQQIVTYLSGYGVTLAVGQVDGPSLTEPLNFEVGPLTEVLNKLSVITGYAWTIDYDKYLSMFPPGGSLSVPLWAPFNITNNDARVIGDITVAPSLSDFANSVIVRFTYPAGAAYAYLEGSANFADGDTITVGKTYTFQSTLTNEDGHVLLASTLSESLDRLIAAINVAAGAGTIYAAATTANTSVTAWRQSDTLMGVRALDAGSGGNSISVSKSAAYARWITEGGGEVDTLQFGFDESLANSATATTDPPPTPAELVEIVFDHPEIRDRATAQAMANGYLTRANRETREIRYPTRNMGFHPGQKQLIAEPKRNLSGEFLITAVDISATGNVLWYDITATEGTIIGPDIRDTYKSWSGSGGQSLSASVILGGGGGGGGTSISTPVALGGVDTAAVPMAATPVYTDVWNVLPFYPSVGFLGTVRVWLWARDAGVGATARLWNVTDAVAVGTSAVVTATSRPAVPATFTVSITAGKEYRLQIISNTSAKSVYGIGTVEAL